MVTSASRTATWVLKAARPLFSDLRDLVRAGPTSPPSWRRSRSPTTVALSWRIAILEPGGRTVEVDTPSGYTLADWQAYAERYHANGCAVTAVLPLLQASGTGRPR